MRSLPLPLLVLVGSLSAAVFLVAIALDQAPAYVLIKALPVFALAAWTAPRADRGITAGLVFGGIGDILLLLPGGFLGGMAAFALGHLAYVWAFVRWDRRPAWLLAMPVVLYVGWTLALVLGGAGAMAAPVAGYACVIGLMIWRAAAVAPMLPMPSTPCMPPAPPTPSIPYGIQAEWTRWLPLCGALLFAFSDTLISVRMFATPLSSGVHFVIIVTYWAGQGLIAAAGVSHRLTRAGVTGSGN